MKIAALTVLGITCCLVGQYIAYTLNMRVKLLEKLLIMLNVTENEIRFLMRPAGEIVTVLSGKSELESLRFLKECNSLMQQGYDFRAAWEKSLNIKGNVRFLKNEDISVLRSFGEMFGVTDTAGQISNCRMHSELITDKLNDARDMRERYSSLSSSMGLITGIGVIIIFI